MKVTAEHIQAFKNIVGNDYVFIDEETLEYFSRDETEKLQFTPEVVVKPRTAEEIYFNFKNSCNKDLLPVTPRGAGTGLSGGALPHLGGVLISTERMNSILHLDERNLQVTTEPGVITEVLQNAVKEKIFFIHPTLAAKALVLLEAILQKTVVDPKL